jgi:DNA-binding transcriptional ArsR family regulator
MAQTSKRLSRLVSREFGACRDGDVEARVETLEAFATEGRAETEGDVEALKTLGSETRYDIVRLLQAADRALCVCEMTPVVGVTESAVSHALADLYEAGLVTRRKEGPWRYYGTTDRSERLLDALDATRGDRR